MASTRILTAELRGSARERGRSHGELLADRIRESGILGFYVGYLERQLPEPRHAALRFALAFLHRRIAARQSEEVRELAAGFCEASGFEEDEVRRGLAMPDALNLVVGLGGRVAEPLAAGCTSVAAWGEYSPDGKLRYGRNLDFPGNGRWDRFPLVSLHKPDSGLPFVSIGSAGSLVDGITGINAEGLTVALHQHINSQAGWLGGRPILDLGERILRTARTIDEAAETASGWRTLSGWTVVLTHAKRKEAAVLERTHRSCELLRFSGGRLARANTYASPGPASAELPYPCFRESSRARAERAGSLLEELKGRVDAAALASILSDHLDADRGRTRSFGQTIAQPHNVTSVVLEPEDGLLWMSEGLAPACDGAFRRISLWDLEVEEGTLEKAPSPLSASQSRAYGRYLEGFEAWLDRSDKRAAFSATADAAAFDPEEPIYRFMNGLFALKCGAPELAAEQLGAGAALPDIAHRRDAQRLWRARALDLLGRRQESTRLYAAVAAEAGHAPLRRAAERGLSRAFREAELGALMPDVTFADTYRY